MDALDCFYSISRQKINKNKSRIYFSSNAVASKKEELCDIMGMRSTLNLGKYLGFPLKQLGSSSQDYNFVIERVQAKLAGWKRTSPFFCWESRPHPICANHHPFLCDAPYPSS